MGLKFYSSLILFISCAILINADRQVSVSWNPDCMDPICNKPVDDSYINLVYVKLTGSNDIVHLMYSTIESFTIMLFRTNLNVNLNIDWDNLLSKNASLMKDSIKFTEEPLEFGGYEIQSIYEFVDYDGSASMAQSNETYTYKTSQMLWDKFVSNESAASGVLIARNKNTKGSYKFLIRYPGKDERDKVLPHLFVKSESSSIDFQIDSIEPKSDLSKFGINLLFLTNMPNLSVSTKRTIDDEYTPGTFKLWNAETMNNDNKVENYLQWKPIFYYSDPKSLENSTITQQYDTRHNDALSNGLGLVFYDDHKLFSSLNVSFGLEGKGKDGYFYNQTQFSSWAFSVGMGAAPSEKMSPIVSLVIFVGFGLPALAIVIGLLVMIVKKIRGSNTSEFSPL
ncbi:unnamed protein product [Brachionus calyciflorus]|uniref:Lysosomal protein NCU-G1 n=1 Tax=Brachionus calyciflorus TaxID=104777 RepID=A0A814MG23_9BILA|nr:unnamed protein product [Brachionus calyciflorus]